MKINKDQMSVSMEGPGTLIRNQTGMGGMTAGYVALPKGTDFTPMFKGLPTNSCHCPHWGYVFEGSIRIIYDDGSEDVTKAGDVFYWQAGHTAIADEDVKFLDFSPEKEFEEVMTQVSKNMEELS